MSDTGEAYAPQRRMSDAEWEAAVEQQFEEMENRIQNVVKCLEDDKSWKIMINNELQQIKCKIQEMEKNTVQNLENPIKKYLEETNNELQQIKNKVQITEGILEKIDCSVSKCLVDTQSTADIQTNVRNLSDLDQRGNYSQQQSAAEKEGTSAGAMESGPSPQGVGSPTAKITTSVPQPSQLPDLDEHSFQSPAEKASTLTAAKRSSPTSENLKFLTPMPPKIQRTNQGDKLPSSDPNDWKKCDWKVRLVAAVKEGRCEMINPKKCDLKFRVRNGNTLLHVAAKHGKGKLVYFLIDKGCLEVNAVNDIGQTALHVAASYYKGYKCVEPLINKGADFNKCDAKGETPLQIAIRNNLTKTVDKLRKYDAKRETPSQCAIRYNLTKTVHKHHKHGRDKNISNNSGRPYIPPFPKGI